MTGTKGTGTRLLCAGAALTLGVLMPATASAQQSRSLSPGVQQFAPSGGPAASPPPSGQVGLVVSARYGREVAQAINSGLLWRIYPVKPDQTGAFRPLKEEKSATASFALPPGDYVVHVTFGLASAARTVHLKSDVTREVFEIPAGGLRMEGRVGDVRI